LFSKWAIKNGGTLFPITFDPTLTRGNSVFNPSISIDAEGTGTLVFRRTNYRYLRPIRNMKSLTSSGSIQYLKPRTDKITNSFFVVKYDFSPSQLNSLPIIVIDKAYWPIFDSNPDFDYSTLEDLRISRFGKKFNFIGNIGMQEGNRRPFYFEIDDINRSQERFHLQNQRAINHPEMHKVEKNWIPIEGNGCELVRWPLVSQESGIDSAQVVSIVEISAKEKNDDEYPNIYGGSQFVEFDGGYISVVHSRHSGIRKNNHRYLHQFFFYDKNLKFIKSSKPFTFLGFDTEFCSGIAIHLEKIFLSFSCNDSLNFVLSFDKKAPIWNGNYESST
jgi:hypothetical protein